MAIEEELSVLVARPPTEVFDHLIAVERWPEWLIASGIVGVERATDDRPSSGEAPTPLGRESAYL